MHEAVSLSNPEPTPYRRIMLVLGVSVVLHALLLWQVGNPLKPSENTVKAIPRTLHLTFQPATRMENPDDTPPIPAELPSTAPASKTGTQSETKTKEGTTSSRSAKRLSERDHTTSTEILTTAREMARQMALRDDSQAKPSQDAVVSALLRAFNSERGRAEVKALADGTIRVVTEYGVVYCIRPKEDWRILGPEDQLSTSVICN